MDQKPKQNITNPIDYACSKYSDEWLHHPVFGDVSYDSFEHSSSNPVVRGTDEMRWPVNGSLFCDPVSGDWFLYVGWYAQGYANTEEDPYYCQVYRSNDKGESWTDCGRPIAGIGSYIFEGEVSPLWGAPDAAVCYKDGRYYMSFDWNTTGTTWANVLGGDPSANNGSACAVSDSPEGPFQPIAAYVKTREMVPVLGKYKRAYASTILPRKDDWIALSLTDSQEYYGWGLLGQTASKLEGPWSEPKLLLHPQLDRYYPQLLEFFPQFIQDGFIYAPATSVAGNRNYQAVFRVPIEDAMDSDAWSLYQDGSVWHSEPVESEYEGIWGQTFSGFIDENGIFNVMFPSLDSESKGTINLAKRPWNQPMRERGFVMSSHVNPGMTMLRHDIQLNHLHAKMKLNGTVQIVWNHRGIFAPDKPTSNCGLHPLMRANYDALEISESSWTLVNYSSNGTRMNIASGSLPGSHERTIDIAICDGVLVVTLDGEICWNGPCSISTGRVGLWLEPHSSIECETFIIDGDTFGTAISFLYTEGLNCAAQKLDDWEEVTDSTFRYGIGAISKSDGVEIKWNFTGTGFAIWAPTGSTYGKGELLLNGQHIIDLDFNTPESTDSHILYETHDLPDGKYGVKVKVIDGRIPIDAFEAFT